MKGFPYALRETQISSHHISLTLKEKISLFLHLQKYLFRYWDKMLVGIFLGFAATYSGVLFPLLHAKFIDFAIPQHDLSYFGILLLYMLVLGHGWSPGFVTMFGNLMAGTCRWYVNMTVGYRLNMMFYKHLHSLSMRFFRRRPVGEHMFRLEGDVGALVGLITNPIPALINMLMGGFLVVGIAFSQLPGWAIGAQYIYLVANWSLQYWVRSVQRRMVHVVRERAQRQTAGLQTIKAFGRHRTEVKRFYHLITQIIRQHLKLFWFGFLTRHIIGNRPPALPWFHGLAVGLTTGILLIQGDLTLGTRMLIITWLGYLVNPFQRLFGLFQGIRLQMISAERVYNTMAVEPSVVPPKSGAKRLPNFRGHVVFENVSFDYADEATVLQDLNFEVKPGQSLGIVGPSGAGKSTLLALLLRLYDPSSGRVLIDGVDLKELHLEEYHHRIGPVMQDTFLYQGSVRENLQFAKPRATDEEILQILRDVDVMDFIDGLVDGLDTDLNEGTRISGGQKQRLGIARALIRDPAMIVLDEPTSSLDVPTEHVVVQTLDKVTEGRTTFFVSHRLALVSRCDTVLVMDEGEIIARGTHKELMESCELYRSMWQEQYGALKEDAGGAPEGGAGRNE